MYIQPLGIRDFRDEYIRPSAMILKIAVNSRADAQDFRVAWTILYVYIHTSFGSRARKRKNLMCICVWRYISIGTRGTAHSRRFSRQPYIYILCVCMCARDRKRSGEQKRHLLSLMFIPVIRSLSLCACAAAVSLEARTCILLFHILYTLWSFQSIRVLHHPIKSNFHTSYTRNIERQSKFKKSI